MSIKEWVIADINKNQVSCMAKEWDIPFFLAVLLSVRKLTNKEDAHKFLYGYNNSSDPFDFVDMDKLKSRTEKAINKLEKICVYGDYDADGVTATTLIYSYLKSRGADVIYYIPKRESDGYGLNTEIINRLHQQGVKLIFTVDNGISACNEVDYAKSLGIDSIITDHHRPPDVIPNAEAVVDPYRKDCGSKFKCFSGVGVAFKAVTALEHGRTELDCLIEKYSDLVTIGTIGDFIELKNETRDLVREGIKAISNANRPGIRVILENVGIYKKEIDTSNVVFGIVPRINVSGRIGNADQSVNLLLADDMEEANEAFKEINKKNSDRRNTENEIYQCIETQLKDEPWRKHERIIIVEGENWHQGVLGIVASRMVKKYGKPCILMTFEGEDAKGSCRSVDNFSIHDAISACSKYLDRFGGHPMAAGINLKVKNIEPFKRAILDYTESFGDMPFLTTNIDCKLNPAALSYDMIDQLEKLKPFGSGNPEPIFGIYSMEISATRPISAGAHLRLMLSRPNISIEVLYFGKRYEEFLYKKGEIVDVAVTVHRNKFSLYTGISLYISDIRLSGSDGRKSLLEKQLYERFKLNKSLSSDEISSLIPSREEITCVYLYLNKYQGTPQRTDIVAKRINKENISSAKVYIILDIIKELKIAQINFTADEFTVLIEDLHEKVDLALSPTLTRLNSIGHQTED